MWTPARPSPEPRRSQTAFTREPTSRIETGVVGVAEHPQREAEHVVLHLGHDRLQRRRLPELGPSDQVLQTLVAHAAASV